MTHFDRRLFLQSTSFLVLGGTSGSLWGTELSQPAFHAQPTFQPTALFLTWQQDPTTTMTVQWIGSAEEALERPVWYRKRGTKGWRRQEFSSKPYPLTDLRVFRAELTGLEPDTEYRFRIGLDSSQQTFRTMPAKSTDAIQFVSGGDSGPGTAAQRTNLMAAAQAPRFVVLGGDLAYENGKDAKRFLAFLSNYSRDLRDPRGLMIPMLGCLGNHEVDGSYGQPREKAPFFYSVFDGLYPETGHACLDFGNYLSLIFLDSEHTTAVTGEQTDWLEKTLKEREEFPTVFVYYHVPAYPSFRSYDGKVSALIRQHWVPLFERYNVDAVMEHHDHTYKRTHPMREGLIHSNGIPYLGDGSWGQIRPVTKVEGHPYLAVAEESYHLSVHRLEDQVRYHLALSDKARVVDMHSTTKRSRRR